MLRFRRRILPVLAVVLAAPITAEFLQAYQILTGDFAAVGAAIVFLAPLYGGAALLIREIVVRTGRGWTATLLLAAAFGLAMPGLIDLAMFGQEASGVPYWAELREATLIPGMQVSAFATLSWVIGHMMMSVGAPLAVLYALAPAHRGRPLLGRVGIPVTLVALSVIAVQLHIDGREIFDFTPTAAQLVPATLLVVTIAVLAVSPLGAPVSGSGTHRRVPVLLVLISAIALKMAVDLIPATWVGLAGLLALLLAACALLRFALHHRQWGPREIGILGVGVIIGGILIGFLAPLPPGVTAAAKVAQNALLLALASLLLIVTLRRTREVREDPSLTPVSIPRRSQ